MMHASYTGAYCFNNLEFVFHRNAVNLKVSSIYVEVFKKFILIPYIKNFMCTEEEKVMYMPFFIVLDNVYIPIYPHDINE